MKTKTYVLLVLLNIFIFSNSNAGWVQQYSGSSTFIASISFPNEFTGFASGWSSTLLKTTNGGTNWITLSSPVSASYQSIYFANVNTGWAVGSDGTIVKTTNSGVTWVQQFSNSSSYLTLTNFVDAQTGYVVGYGGTILKTSNGGTNWVSQNSGVNVNLLSVKFINVLTGYVTGDYSRILKTTNGGSTWISLVSGIYNNLGKIAVINSSTAIVPATDGTVFRTSNGGDYWIAQSSSTANYLVSANFPSENTGYISGGNGSIIKSTNGGLNWVLQYTPVSVELHWVYFINNMTGWATGYNGTIIKTTDGGLQIPTVPILVSPSNSSMINTLTPYLSWNSSMGANNYSFQVSEVPDFSSILDSSTTLNTNYHVPSGKFTYGHLYYWRVKASNILGASAWSTIWNFNITVTGLANNSSSTPSDFKLYSNYPNPFNPATKIKFDQPVKSHTSLIVYDALGRAVQTLVNTELKEGTYEYTWDASKYNSGVYFVRIISDKFAETKKMMLVK